MNVTGWAIRNLKPILFVAAALCTAGVLLYPSFPVSILPDVTFPRIVVIAEIEDRPARMVEASISRPLEEALATIPNVQKIRTQTKKGSTEISVDFAPGTDVPNAEQLVNARVSQARAQIPAETSIEVERMNPTVFPVLGLTLKSKSLSPTQLWNLATYTLRPRLARVDGVARVIVQGGRAPEIAVLLRPSDLAALGLSSADISTALANTNEIRDVGRFNRQFQQFEVTINGELKSAEDVRQVVVGQSGGRPVRLYQVADVIDSEEDRTTIVSANGEESVLLNVIRQPSANSVAMVQAVNDEIKRLRPNLPSDVEIGSFYDQSVLVREAIGSVRDAVLIGAALSIFVLLIFLRDLRATVVTALIIPITLLITFVLMRLAGLTLNLMTLGALAVGIGLIVDDAIVVVEAVFRNLAGSSTIPEAVGKASGQIAVPMISSTMTTVVVFLPLAFLSGVTGAFFASLALTLTFALMVSLALALCVSPSLCAAFLRKSSDRGEGEFFIRFLRGYEKLLGGLLRRNWIVLPLLVLIAAGTWFLGGKLTTGFMPEMDEGAFVLDYLSPPGTSLEESDRILKKVDEILKQTPEVDTFSRRLGTELGFAITESNRGDYAVMLKSNRKRGIDDVMADVRKQVQTEVPGLEVEFIQVLQDLVGDLAGAPNPVEVKLFGENKAEVEEIASDLATRLGKIKGFVEVRSEAKESGPEAQFIVDPGAAGRYGVTVDSIADQANASLNGKIAAQILRGDRQVPIRVRFPANGRMDLDQIGNIGIQTPVGRVQLKDLARIELVTGTTQSYREDQRRVVSVTGRLDGLDLGAGVLKVRKALAETKLPPGVTAVVAGQFKSQQESFANLTLVLGAAVILVFTVMLFQFRSFVAPTVILILMPLSMFGAVLGLWICGTALNVSSFMGIIMLAGIVVKNGILLLDRAQTAMEDGAGIQEAIRAAGEARLRPILMTTLTAVLGLLPLAFGIGAGAEMQKPLAISVVGGLIFSTFLTLFAGPALYSLILGWRPNSIRQ